MAFTALLSDGDEIQILPKLLIDNIKSYKLNKLVRAVTSETELSCVLEFGGWLIEYKANSAN